MHHPGRRHHRLGAVNPQPQLDRLADQQLGDGVHFLTHHIAHVEGLGQGLHIGFAGE
ncbi:hypothetical protein D3C72_2102370 [compost metagenome]